MKRNVMAVVAAIVTGGIVVFILDFVGHAIYPVEPGLDLSRPESVSEYMKSIPVGALMLVAFSQAAGAYSGGFVSGLISKSRTVALAYGVFALLLGVLNLLAIPHPVWLSVVLILVPVPAAVLGFRSAELFRDASSVEGTSAGI